MSMIEVKLGAYHLTPKVQASLTELITAMKEAEQEQNREEQALFENHTEAPAIVQNIPLQPQEQTPIAQPAPAPPQIIPPAPPTSVPVTSPPDKRYTLGELSTAAAGIIGSKRQELLGLLAQFGAESLHSLPQEQYGAFATALRGIGAKI